MSRGFRFLPVLSLTFVLLLVSCGLASADPRITGRVVGVDTSHRIISIKCSDGRTVRARLRPNATIERYSTATTLGSFCAGEYVVLEIGGPLNDSVLDAEGLYDVHTAGQAPKPKGSVDWSIRGGFETENGGAAPEPFPTPNANAMVGGGQNVSTPANTGWHAEWNPIVPWKGVPNAPGQSLPQPVLESTPMQPCTPTPGSRPVQEPGVNAYGPTNSASSMSFPQISQAGAPPAAPPPKPMFPGVPQAGTSDPPPPTVSAAPQSGYVAQPQAPVVTQPRTVAPDVMYGNPYAVAQQAAAGAQIVSLTGTISRVDVAHRMLLMLAMINGQMKPIQVRVPEKMGFVKVGEDNFIPLDNIRPGDMIAVTAIQIAPGLVQAQRAYINH